MNRSIFSLAVACLTLLAFASGCDDGGSIFPDMEASIAAATNPEHAPASAPSPASVAPVAPAAPVAASVATPSVVTLGPGTVCTTFPDGITTCTGANGSSTRIAGLF